MDAQTVSATVLVGVEIANAPKAIAGATHLVVTREMALAGQFWP
jgi:hypothetical protein